MFPALPAFSEPGSSRLCAPPPPRFLLTAIPCPTLSSMAVACEKQDSGERNPALQGCLLLPSLFSLLLTFFPFFLFPGGAQVLGKEELQAEQVAGGLAVLIIFSRLFVEQRRAVRRGAVSESIPGRRRHPGARLSPAPCSRTAVVFPLRRFARPHPLPRPSLAPAPPLRTACFSRSWTC